MQKVDEYIEKKKEWKKELQLLRELLTKSELVEDYKWSVPTYTINGKNVIGMAGFKKYVGLWFFQGVFLKDKRKLLINAQENKTKGLRQLRFQSIDEIKPDVLVEYIEEAIQNQKDGKEIEVVRTKTITIPELLQEALKKNDVLNTAFERLSAGKRKEYAEYISTAKREATKATRLEKITPMILQGVGLHDQYKNC